MTAPTVTTARLRLRAFAPEDAGPLHAIVSEAGVLRYFPRTEPPALDWAQALVESQTRLWEARGYGWWAVERRDTPGLIGWNGLQYLPETDEVEVGFLLRKDCWGLGLATEGGRAALRLGFEGLGLEEIVGIVHPENIASQRVLEKLGLTFVEEAEYFGMRVWRYAIEADSGWEAASR